MKNSATEQPKSLYKIAKRLLGLVILLLVGFLAWLLLFSTDQVKTVPRNIPDDSPPQSSY